MRLLQKSKFWATVRLPEHSTMTSFRDREGYGICLPNRTTVGGEVRELMQEYSVTTSVRQQGSRDLPNIIIILRSTLQITRLGRLTGGARWRACA